MSKVLIFIFAVIILFIYLAIEDSTRNSDIRNESIEYLNKLPNGIKPLIEFYSSDSINLLKKNDEEYILNSPLLLFKDKNEVKLFKDISKNIDSLSSFDTAKIGTIILIQISEVSVGEYNNGADAIRRNFKINFINQKEKLMYFEKIIEGEDPPKTITRRQGDKYPGGGQIPPYDEVIKYISSCKKISK